MLKSNFHDQITFKVTHFEKIITRIFMFVEISG